MTPEQDQPNRDESDQDDLEAWRPPKPLPPVPEFPEIPKHLRERDKAGEPHLLTGIGAGWAMALDFVFTIVGGFLIGFAIDYWQNTRPWGSLIGLGVGFASAIVRILRRTAREERQGASRK